LVVNPVREVNLFRLIHNTSNLAHDLAHIHFRYNHGLGIGTFFPDNVICEGPDDLKF
jgi:hypothetical protein